MRVPVLFARLLHALRLESASASFVKQLRLSLTGHAELLSAPRTGSFISWTTPRARETVRKPCALKKTRRTALDGTLQFSADQSRLYIARSHAQNGVRKSDPNLVFCGERQKDVRTFRGYSNLQYDRCLVPVGAHSIVFGNRNADLTAQILASMAALALVVAKRRFEANEARGRQCENRAFKDRGEMTRCIRR
jgi:hypothetical protein